jgi:predicted acetyltransferase
MMRILDVTAALEGRGYPEVEGEATIAVADDIFTENTRTYALSSDSGKLRVEAVSRRARTELPIGMLSALYSGYVTPNDLVRLGQLDPADPAIGLLSRLFAGPPPWMPDFF